MSAALTCGRHRGVWEHLHTLPSMVDAKAFLKLIPDPRTGDEHPLPLSLQWQRARSNGVTHVYYCCVSHKDCPYEVRIRQDSSGLWHVEELHPEEHSSCPGLQRKNSITTPQEEALILMLADSGAILNQLTLEYLKLCKRQGITPQKRPEGGLVGARSPQVCDALFFYGFRPFL